MSLRQWRANRKHRHFHIMQTESGAAAYQHSHLDHELWHTHEVDMPCNREDCAAFNLHRLHPRPGPVPVTRFTKGTRVSLIARLFRNKES